MTESFTNIFSHLEEREREMRDERGQIGKLFSLECAAAVLAGDETLSVTL